MMMKVITQEDWNLQWVTQNTWLRFAQLSCPLPGRQILIIIVIFIIIIVIIIMNIINIIVIKITFVFTVDNQDHHCRDFAPDMVLVSAGFDAGVGHEHPIGGYKVSDADGYKDTGCFLTGTPPKNSKYKKVNLG